MGFLDKVLGTAGGNDDIRHGYDQSKIMRRKGANAYKSIANQTLNDTKGYFEPYYQQGLDVSNTYRDAIGEGTPEAQQDYFANFNNDPGFQASLDKALDGVQRSAAASGSLHSGRTQMALFDRGQAAQYGAFQDRLNRLEALGSKGQQAGAQLANYTYNTGNNIADLENMIAQQDAAGFMGVQNQVASSRGSGFQGALNLGAVAAKAYAGLPPLPSFGGAG